METLDWIVVGIYIAAIVGMSVWISRRQKSEADYYLAGRKMGAWPLALSIVATQCSANSLLGTPAFIAMKQGGGLCWLQYELAVPLAMIGVFLLLPIFFRRGITTIYEVVEDKFGVGARASLSGIFIFSRALGTGVTLYATALVMSACLSWPLTVTLLFVGFVSILYTTLGGIEADIYSDIFQLIVLFAGTVICIVVVLKLLGGFPTDFSAIDPGRLQVLRLNRYGLGDGDKFGFWPMLIGGFFLYISYYGCDQSQAQRLLSGENQKVAQRSLLLNGLLRFPLVCTYCLFGLLLAVWLTRNSGFAEHFTEYTTALGEKDNLNYLVPLFILEYMPAGIRGIIVAGIIAATMSSLDSTINSLSAATQKDFLERFKVDWKGRFWGNEVFRARAITVMWGIVCTGLAFFFLFGGRNEEGSAGATVLELVNMVGSAVYGPILAVFLLTLFSRRISSLVVVVALLAGVGCNMLLLGLLNEYVAWWWWNVSGCAVTGGIALLGSIKMKVDKSSLISTIVMVGMFVLILAVLIILNIVLQ
ncbi:MAG: sodium/solute symporter [Sedimentisphaerales bacterium]|nr:sodium/solute symporter [Sedimentisphaerales bacterium]